MKERLKTMFTRNIGMKLLSVVLAFFIWIIIMSISNPYITMTIDDIPVERRNVEAVEDENMVYETLSGDTVSIRIKGMRSEIENLTAQDFEAYVDFAEIGWVNAVPIHVELKDKSLEEYLEITNQSNDVMSIDLVEYTADMVMVEIRMINVPDEYYAYCSSVSSKLIEVSGSKTQVESVEKLVAIVDLDGRTTDFMTYVRLQAYDDKGAAIDASKITIAQDIVQVDIDMMPVKEVPLVIDTSDVVIAEGFGLARVEYSPKSVLIGADSEVLATIDSITIPYKSETLLQSKEEEIDLTKYLPEGVFLKSETTVVYLNLVVERLVSKDISINTADIEVRGLPERFGLSIPSSKVTLQLNGLEDELQDVTAEDIALYIDMTACTGAGTYEVPVRTDNTLVDTNTKKLEVVVYDKE